MEICFNIALELNKAVASAAHALPQFDESFDPIIRPADPRFGDFQANGVLPYAKRNRINPRQAALDLCRSLNETECLNPDYLSFEVAGAGFINFQLTPTFLTEWLQKYQTETDLRDAAEQIYRGKTVCSRFQLPQHGKATPRRPHPFHGIRRSNPSAALILRSQGDSGQSYRRLGNTIRNPHNGYKTPKMGSLSNSPCFH